MKVSNKQVVTIAIGALVGIIAYKIVINRGL